MVRSDLESAEFLRAVLDAVPTPMFVTDNDVTVLAMNPASEALAAPEARVLKRRGGDLLGCLHASETPEGCGHADACKTCTVRLSVGSALSGQAVRRSRTSIDLLRDGAVRRAQLLVSATPFDFRGEPLALLVLEDVTKLEELQDLVPICAWCKKVRTGERYWESVERWLERNMDLACSHSICEECMAREFPDR